jgi:hypothetical protein
MSYLVCGSRQKMARLAPAVHQMVMGQLQALVPSSLLLVLHAYLLRFHHQYQSRCCQK